MKKAGSGFHLSRRWNGDSLFDHLGGRMSLSELTPGEKAGLKAKLYDVQKQLNLMVSARSRGRAFRLDMPSGPKTGVEPPAVTLTSFPPPIATGYRAGHDKGGRNHV
jgi:hypothetical protein